MSSRSDMTAETLVPVRGPQLSSPEQGWGPARSAPPSALSQPSPLHSRACLPHGCFQSSRKTPRPAAARKLLDPLMFVTWMSQVQSRLVELIQVTGFQECPSLSLLVLHLGVERDPKFTPRTDPGP